jgi:hypothetical protein
MWVGQFAKTMRASFRQTTGAALAARDDNSDPVRGSPQPLV